jgi:hypothetical protein
MALCQVIHDNLACGNTQNLLMILLYKNIL